MRGYFSINNFYPVWGVLRMFRCVAIFLKTVPGTWYPYIQYSTLEIGTRTDGVHCREPAGTGPVNLKVVANGCCLGRSP